MNTPITPIEALDRAIALAGGQVALADRLSARLGYRVKQQRVSYWRAKQKTVPPEFAVAIQAETGVSARALCPEFPWHALPCCQSADRAA